MNTTPIDGIYSVYLTGQSGNGFAIMIMMNGKVTGADAMGILFDGDYSPATSGQGWHTIHLPNSRIRPA